MNYNYKGKILISTPDIAGDIFSRSVVLIIDHNAEGAFGLILNKRNNSVSARLQKIFDFRVDVYDGGPVETDKIFFIVKGAPVTEHFLKVSDDYYVTEDVENIVDALISEKIIVGDIKAFAGYSGWAAGQLEQEVERKSWTPVEVFNLDYTYPNDHNLWKDIMQNLGGEYLLWANSPENVQLN